MSVNPSQLRSAHGFPVSSHTSIERHTGSELSGIPTVPAGTCLTEGDVYLDMAQPGRGPFRAMRWECAGSRNRFVAKSSVSEGTWDLLVRSCAYASLIPNVDRPRSRSRNR